MLPKNDRETQAVINSIQTKDLAYEIRPNDKRYWVWKFYFKSSSPDTIVLTVDAKSMTIVDMFEGVPDEETIRKHLATFWS